MDYVLQLVAKYPSITEVWLYGSRADDTAGTDSDWDYLAFANRKTLSALSLDTGFHLPKIDLMVVTDGQHFEKPWADPEGQKSGTLADDLAAGGLAWKLLSEKHAEYLSIKPDPTDASKFRRLMSTRRARRVYP
jgi:hypothetical protein